MKPIREQNAESAALELASRQVSRRNFLRFAGITSASAALIITSCGKDEFDQADANNNGVNLGSGDVGVLNYAYALEQLEAAFYTQVATSPYGGISAMEKQYLEEIRDHEIAHREFFKKALGNSAIPGLEVDFSSINFSNRDSVLATAKAFEDLGVSAYNGAGKLLTDPNNLLIAGKIVSVEARHAALVRDLISNGSFADNTVIDMNGLDKSRSPMEVLQIAAPFIKTKINASNLPVD
jgi:hypothetical protein